MTKMKHDFAALERKSEEETPDDIVTKALAELTGKVDNRLAEIEAKSDTKALAERLDKIEAKGNRAKGGGEDKGEPTEERKAFASYLRHGDKLAEEDRKALNVSNDQQGGFLAPPEMSNEVIRDLVEFSPIRTYASVRGTTADSVIFPTRGDLTNAQWVGEMEPHDESTITFGQREIEVNELATFVDISNRLLQDAPIAETEVRAALAEDFGKKEAEAFLWGTGVKMPEGIMVNPAIPEIANGDAANLATDALIRLMYSLPQAYRIVDRLSMSVLVDPYTRARERITRLHATRRVGGGVLQPARFRKLKMATA